MFTVSCYTFHPLASRYVRLRRRVHVVSEWMVCVMATVCCPCCTAMPLASSASCYSKASELLETVQKPVIDPGRTSGEPFRPQHITVDFTPGAEDSSAVEDKCYQFWEFVTSQPELDAFTVQPDSEISLPDTTYIVSRQEPHNDVENQQHYPAIHAMRKMEDKGAVDAALNIATTSKR
ncbi:uncharacterized protein LOC115447065 [Manduca sexta]|uniref:uncharacterized protein LOC115447065 n=1 Tax=Manduca sexta TaxID=7130 RepID=UPI00188F8A3C|nr:uncharacterized protein LOC115447065 [Manduca sexta]